MNETVKNVGKTAFRDKSGKFKHGNPGKPKGAKDKIIRTAKENIEKVVKELGGYEGILKWAEKNSHNQGLLYGWYFKMLPTNVNVEGDLSISYQLSEKFMPKMDNEKK